MAPFPVVVAPDDSAYAKGGHDPDQNTVLVDLDRLSPQDRHLVTSSLRRSPDGQVVARAMDMAGGFLDEPVRVSAPTVDALLSALWSGLARRRSQETDGWGKALAKLRSRGTGTGA